MDPESQNQPLLETQDRELDRLAEALADMLTEELTRTGATLIEVTLMRANGVRIEIRPRDHYPPHFHVTSGRQNAAFDISTCDIVRGNLEPRAVRAVKDWYGQHKADLQSAWDRTRPGTCSVGESLHGWTTPN
jgi:hypothetical protein